MRCPSCTGVATFACSGCKNARYCSLSCQQSDWRFHKILCKTFKDFEQRPSPELRRVIFFPVTAEKPEFRWLPVQGISDGETVAWNLLMGDGFSARASAIASNNIVGAMLKVPIALCSDRDALIKYPTSNPAVLAATNQKGGDIWRGPMLAYGAKRLPNGKIRVEDLDMASFSDLVAYLIDHDDDFDSDGRLPSHQRGPKIPGVRTNCTGQQALSRPCVLQDLIPRMHPILEEGEISGISRNIGMPLRVWKHAPRKFPNHPGLYGTVCNQSVTFIMLCCDSADPRFGWAPPFWMGGQASNVLVSRADRQPLDILTFEAFAHFCECHMLPLFEWATEFEGNEEAQKLVMEQMTPSKWRWYELRWRVNWFLNLGEPDKSAAAPELAEARAKLRAVEEEEEPDESIHERLWDEGGRPQLPKFVRRE